MDNSNKIILDLCGGTGSWSKKYREADYDVRLITLPKDDVCNYHPPLNVYGILAAVPCTDFSVSGAQYWDAKDKDGRTIESLKVLTHVLKIIAYTQPLFWAIENPVGRLRDFLGSPRQIFNPCDFGDPYTKKTLLWGRFNSPLLNSVKPEFVIAKNGDKYSKIHWSTGGKSEKTKMLRSITPPAFAKAFFEANQ